MIKSEILGCWVKNATDLDLENFSHRELSQPEPLPRGLSRPRGADSAARGVLATAVTDRWDQTVSVEKCVKRVGLCIHLGQLGS